MGGLSLSSSIPVSTQLTDENRTEICARAKAVLSRLSKEEVECIDQFFQMFLREQSIYLQQRHLEENKSLLERLKPIEIQTSQNKIKEDKEIEELKTEQRVILQENPAYVEIQQAKKEKTKQIQQVQNENLIQLEQVRLSQEETLAKNKENLQQSGLRVEQMKATAEQFSHQARKILDEIEIVSEQEEKEVAILQVACDQKIENIKKLDKEIQAPNTSILTGVIGFWKKMTALTPNEKTAYLAKIIFDWAEIVLTARAEEQPSLYKRAIHYVNCNGYLLIDKVEPVNKLLPYLVPGVLESIKCLKHQHMFETARLIQQTMKLTSWKEFDQMDQQQKNARIQLLIDAIISKTSLPSLKVIKEKMQWTSQDHMYSSFHFILLLFSKHLIYLTFLTGVDSSYLIGRVQLLEKFDCSDHLKW